MIGTDPALSNLAESLVTVAERGDVSLLRAHLSGRTLPAMGGNEDPADILLRALSLTPRAPELMRPLARLLGALIFEEVVTLKAEGSTPRRLSLLRSSLYLASALPTEPSLFSSLKNLLGALDAPEPGRDASTLSLPLWQALVYQQTDASLEETWLSLLEPKQPGASTPAQRTLLLTAWRGLLWIPPSPEAWRVGEITNFDRIQTGLLGVYRWLMFYQDKGFGRDEALSFLGACLDILQETYPRSSDFWTHSLQSRINLWPADLLAVARSRWPLLSQVDSDSLKPSTQEGIKETEQDALGRALRTTADFDALMADLRAKVNGILSFYESHHVEEALRSAATLSDQFVPLPFADRLSRDIDSLSRQVEILRSLQSTGQSTPSGLQDLQSPNWWQTVLDLVSRRRRPARKRR